MKNLTASPEEHFSTLSFDDGVWITDYSGPGGAVTFPGSIGGRPVRTIGGLAFQDRTELTALIFPDSLQYLILDYFCGCNSLTHIVLPAGVTSFSSSGFDLHLPALKIIVGSSHENFSLCRNLAHLHVSNELNIRNGRVLKLYDGRLWRAAYEAGERYAVPPTQQLPRFAFAMHPRLRFVTLPEGMTVIATGAFLGCEVLEEAVVPEGVTAIRRRAFQDCPALRFVTLPRSLTQISRGAFAGCPRLTLRVPEGSYAHRYAIDHAVPFELI